MSFLFIKKRKTRQMVGKSEMISKFIIFLILLTSIIYPTDAYSKHFHHERYYQNEWCSGYTNKRVDKVTEIYVYSDGMYVGRVDCLTDKYAIEFDFSYKWAESYGQALMYAALTGKEPAVVLIVENKSDLKHIKKLQILSDTYVPVKIFIINNINED